MRAGQFEAMGLAVIVVLISLGMFLLLFFSLRSPPDFVSRYYYEELGQNTIEAMLIANVQTSTGTCASTFQDLLQDVAVRGTNSCGEDSATLLAKGLDKVLNSTLDQKALRYNFSVVDADGTLYMRGVCDPTREQHDRPGFESLPFFPSATVVNITLYVCSS